MQCRCRHELSSQEASNAGRPRQALLYIGNFPISAFSPPQHFQLLAAPPCSKTGAPLELVRPSLHGNAARHVKDVGSANKRSRIPYGLHRDDVSDCQLTSIQCDRSLPACSACANVGHACIPRKIDVEPITNTGGNLSHTAIPR